MPVPSMLERGTPVPAHVAVGSSARTLARVTRPGVNLAVWLRDAPALAPSSIVGAVAVDEVIAPRAGLGRSLVPTAVSSTLRAQVGADIDAFAGVLRRLSGGAGALRVKLNSCDGDECRLFHVDHVAVRLITTYVGPGTDWLEDGAARRQHLGGRGLPRRSSIDTINNAIVSDWTRVHRLPRFAVAAFRGSRAVGADAIVHRSPPIAGTGIVRLRLVVEVQADDSADGCAA
jgi:hypothetical protein